MFAVPRLIFQVDVCGSVGLSAPFALDQRALSIAVVLWCGYGELRRRLGAKELSTGVLRCLLLGLSVLCALDMGASFFGICSIPAIALPVQTAELTLWLVAGRDVRCETNAPGIECLSEKVGFLTLMPLTFVGTAYGLLPTVLALVGAGLALRELGLDGQGLGKGMFCGTLAAGIVRVLVYETFLPDGFAGVATKDGLFNVALATVLLCCAACHVVSSELPRREELRCGYPPELCDLSERQRDVVVRLAGGMSVSRIAEVLTLAPGAVGEYRRRAFHKLGVDQVSQLESLVAPVSKRAARAERRGALHSLIVLLWLVGLWSLGAVWDPGSLNVMRGTLLLAPTWVVTAVHADDVQLGRAASPLALLSLLCLALYCLTLNIATGMLGSALPLLCITMLALPLAAACISGESGEFGCADRLSAALRRVTPSGKGELILFSALIAAAPGITRVLWKSEQMESLAFAFYVVTVLAELCLCGFAFHRRAKGVPKVSVPNEAMTSRLRALGLGDVQTAVLLDTAAGFTRPQICAMRHVAEGTVNDYRRQGYRLLGVKSARELRERLDEIAGNDL